MHVQVHDSIDEISATGWNRLAGLQPFLQHEFLAALEHSGCVGAQTGWQPQHLACTDDSGELIGALPLYLKTDSWGEFVFDWSWAEAYERAGRRYYPKLVSAVPFSPVTGPRLLIHENSDQRAVAGALAAKSITLADELHASSVHCLFPSETETPAWLKYGFLLRKDCQFHWHNRGYHSFDDYLATFSAEKRKKLKRERRRVSEAGITHRVCRGGDLNAKNLNVLYTFYAATYAKRGREPYLNRSFFDEIARSMPDSLLVSFAMLNGGPIACTICFRDADTLYGRHWGCLQEYHSLHFETCYYQWLDYCIRERLRHFDPGAQGEHKLARGFEPVATWSLHYATEPAFREAIRDFLKQETRWVDGYIAAAVQHLPYRHDDPSYKSPPAPHL